MDNTASTPPSPPGGGDSGQSRLRQIINQGHVEINQTRIEQPSKAPEAPKAQEQTPISQELPPSLETSPIPENQEAGEVPQGYAPTQQPQVVQAPPSIPVQPTISTQQLTSLPLTEEEIEIAQKRNIHDAIRWLAVWCLRQIKKQKNPS